MREFLLMLIVF